jgi:hypothetical protein
MAGPDQEHDEDEAIQSSLSVELYREYWGRGEEIRQYEAEKEHNRRVFGQTYREINGRDHKRCIVLCLDPGQRQPVRCPTCYGKIGVRAMREMPDVDPVPTRGERLAAWLGRCAGEFIDGARYPFRAGREHTVAVIRDVLQDAMAAGLAAEIVQVCPSCEAAGNH